MAVQMSWTLRPPLRRVMAKFLARLASSRVTLVATFCAALLLAHTRSSAGPCALVLNSSSKRSRSRS